MKTFVLCALFLFFAVTFAQLSAGDQWQGVWSEGKRSLGGSLYICADPWTQTAYGTYSNVGLFSGYLFGNTLTGYWYEAGYDRPFGPFRLTINGNSFTGTWSYFQGNETFTWSGSRQSSVKPSDTECLVPHVTGHTAEGVYNGGQYICLDQTVVYDNTEQTWASATFANFGSVVGFSPDNGRTVSLSDFTVSNTSTALFANNTYRPENNIVKIGTAIQKFTAPADAILTSKIVIGRQITDMIFCGFFWDGLYVRQYSDKAICFEKTSVTKPSAAQCEIASAADNNNDVGITAWLLSQIQSVLNHIEMPHITIPVDGPIIRFPTWPVQQEDDDDVPPPEDDDQPQDDDDVAPTYTWISTIPTAGTLNSGSSTLVFSVAALVASLVVLI